MTDTVVLTKRQISARLRKVTFVNGYGSAAQDTACLISAVNMVRGVTGRRTDSFDCPVIRDIAIKLNDAEWPSVAARTKALKPYVEKIHFARVTPKLRKARQLACVRMAINVFAADALESAATALRAKGVGEHAEKLESHAKILRAFDHTRLSEARDAANAAYAAAYAANAANAAANAANAANAAYAANAASAAYAAAYAAYAANAANAAYAAAYAANAANAASAAYAKRKNLMLLLDAVLEVSA